MEGRGSSKGAPRGQSRRAVARKWRDLAPIVVKRRRTGNVARPHRAVVSDVGPHALAVVRVPQGGVVVLGAGEHQITLPVILDEG